MYVAEWLVVEYHDDREICPKLKILFDELSALALRDIGIVISVRVGAGVKQGGQLHH